MRARDRGEAALGRAAMANYAEEAVTFSWPGAVGAPGDHTLVLKY
jgi:hypothetical protein